jgi:signal transduction histidine kinase
MEDDRPFSLGLVGSPRRLLNFWAICAWVDIPIGRRTGASGEQRTTGESMERVLATGPELAEKPSEMAAILVQPETAERPPSAATARRSLPTPRREDVVPAAYYLVVCAVLASVGFPAWRIAVLALGAVLPRAQFYLLSSAPGSPRYDPKRCVNAGPETVAWWVLVTQSTLFVSTALAAAVTGGVRSPVLVTIVAAYASAASLVGDRVQTRILLGATAAAVVVLAALPRAWTGPELPGAVHAALVAVAVLGIGALMTPADAMARRRRSDLARAREEMASDALGRAQTLEQIGTNVAHELKNPLTGVKALVQLGLRNPAEAASHERLDVVEREVTRMQEILQNYLSFTRPLQEVAPRQVELGTLVSDTLEVLSPRADHARVRLYAQGDALVEADPRRLKEALLNLVANAIEATPPGGKVDVEVRPAGDGAEIVIRDTGRGMEATTLRRIGTPFFTTRDDGTGLGVVLARSVIAQHGGSLRYESEPGQGTRVRVALPRASRGGRHGACAPRG